MDAYSRLYWWLINARKAKGFAAHPFKDKVTAMTLRYGVQSREIGKRGNTAILLQQQLFSKDSKLALTIFMMLIDPDSYVPQIGQPFASWRTAQTEYEFDHQGSFKEVKPDLHHYDGAEIDPKQRLIDGVLTLGFRKTTIFSLRIFVPIIPAVQTEMSHGRSLTVMRRQDQARTRECGCANGH